MMALFVTTVGSKLYGTNTESSDIDLKGFAFDDVDQLIGLKNFEQQTYNNGVADGPSKIEGSVYSLKKYIKMCMTGNPTVIEIAFADKQFWTYTTPIGEEVCKYVRDNFLTKALFKPYSDYHRDQVRKLQSMNRTGKRAEIVEKYGFDTKFAGHSYRLARQCSIVMSEGTLRPTLDPADKQMCLDIRNGKYNKEEALKILEDVDKQMYDAYKISTLKNEPDFNDANDFTVNLYKRYINGEFDVYNQTPFKPF